MVLITMNPPLTTRKAGTPVASRRLRRRGHEALLETRLNGDDLLGDLDPGWLDWRDRQSRR
jgi:hypothetical protein